MLCFSLYASGTRGTRQTQRGYYDACLLFHFVLDVLLLLQNVVLRDALVALLTEQRRKFMTGGDLCAETVLQALLEAREASLGVIEAVKR